MELDPWQSNRKTRLGFEIGWDQGFELATTLTKKLRYTESLIRL